MEQEHKSNSDENTTLLYLFLFFLLFVVAVVFTFDSHLSENAFFSLFYFVLLSLLLFYFPFLIEKDLDSYKVPEYLV